VAHSTAVMNNICPGREKHEFSDTSLIMERAPLLT